MKRLPELIRASVTIAGRPAPGLAVSTSIKTTRKNSFGCIWGPSDASGVIAIKGSDLFAQADADRRFFIMDYGHPEGDASGIIELAIENVDALDGALKASGIFSAGDFPYPPGYQRMLLDARQRTVELGDRVPHLGVESEGGDCLVVAVQWAIAG
jgi:hypothetical protein